MNFEEIDIELKKRLINRASNHEGTSALTMFEKIPERLRDSNNEINEWLDTHQWSHIYPSSLGGTEAIWETTKGNPNQVRGDNIMSDLEIKNIEINNIDSADKIDNLFTDDQLLNNYDKNVSLIIPDWSNSLSQAFIGIGITGFSGYIIGFSLRVGRNILCNKKQLIKDRKFRKSFLEKVINQSHQQGLKGSAIAFLMAFICSIFPPFKFLLSTAALIGLARLGLELFSSVINHCDPLRKGFISQIFDLTKGALNLAARVLSNLWIQFGRVVDWVSLGIEKILDKTLKISTAIFKSVGKMMNWLLAMPTIASI